ncbi:alpha/beta fold hydrolase [Rheinheimera sp. 4Y26]|uniref:alpha/beta fold hydrolase n=1 Tax=Rheinheimera sp. 4Y26 TaxID=2977811 RepID=UPI0021B12E9A|nr:alpha/beta fold hydrolase [Rheinheimera sp. 4Y26]MCT6699499.1 alpha/beta fold hydrolase [Rheinheimera sp. 4Y26]
MLQKLSKIKTTKVLSKLLSAMLLSGAGFAAADTNTEQNTGPDNPFMLLTEQELAQKDVELAQFWQQQVVTGFLKAADGTPLFYAYHKPAEAKATILIVTGRTEAIAKYQELFFELGRLGYAVLGYDHRGQGQSGRLLADAQIGHVTSFADYVQDLHLLQKELSPLLPKDKVLLAHSMGGAVASSYLATYPGVFKAAALSAPMHAPNTELVFGAKDGCYLQQLLGWTCPDCYAGFASSPYQNSAFANNIYSHSEVRYRRFRQLFKQQPGLQLGGPSWQWLREACAIADQMPDIASQIRVPVKILQAGEDLAVTAEAQQLFCDTLGRYCDGGAVMKIAGARHEILFEADRYRMPALTEILRFYQQQLAL